MKATNILRPLAERKEAQHSPRERASVWLEMKISSPASQALSPRVQRLKGRSSTSRVAVKCDPGSSVVEGGNRTGEDLENRKDLECGIISEDLKSESRGRRLSGGRVEGLLNLIRQQVQHQYLSLCSSSRAQQSGKGGDLVTLQRIRARRLKTLFALAQHFDNISNSLETGPFQTCPTESGCVSGDDAVQLEAKLSHMSILS